MMTNERLSLEHFRKLLPNAKARLNEIAAATNRAIFTPEPFEPADTWAEGNIELPPEVSEQGGYVRLLGYQRELVLAPFEPGVRVVTVMKSARVGNAVQDRLIGPDGSGRYYFETAPDMGSSWNTPKLPPAVPMPGVSKPAVFYGALATGYTDAKTTADANLDRRLYKALTRSTK